MKDTVSEGLTLGKGLLRVEIKELGVTRELLMILRSLIEKLNMEIEIGNIGLINILNNIFSSINNCLKCMKIHTFIYS